MTKDFKRGSGIHIIQDIPHCCRGSTAEVSLVLDLSSDVIYNKGLICFYCYQTSQISRGPEKLDLIQIFFHVVKCQRFLYQLEDVRDENPGVSGLPLFRVMKFWFGLFQLWRSHSPHRSSGTNIKVPLSELSAVEGQNI